MARQDRAKHEREAIAAAFPAAAPLVKAASRHRRISELMIVDRQLFRHVEMNVLDSHALKPACSRLDQFYPVMEFCIRQKPGLAIVQRGDFIRAADQK
jgi:hypothetical protein